MRVRALVCVRCPNRNPLVSQTAIAADIHHALDVHRIACEIAFHLPAGVTVRIDAILLAQLANSLSTLMMPWIILVGA